MLSRFKLLQFESHQRCVFLGICLALAVSACGTTTQIPETEIQSKYANLTPGEALKLTTERFTRVISEQYEIYSPSNWNDASDALLTAQNIAKQDASSLEILKHIYLVDRRLESAKYIKNSVQKQYKDLFIVQSTLKDNQATRSYPEEFKKVELQLKDFIKEYEDFTLGKNKETVNQRSLNISAHMLLENMQTLNMRVVKYNFLEQSKQDLAKVKKLDANNLAPQTYQAALDALRKAYQYIEQHVHDKQGIQDKADSVRFAVDHVTHVTNAVIELSRKEVKQLEQVILDHEQQLYMVGQTLGSQDVRNLSLTEQTQAIVNTANNILEHHTEKSSMIVDLSEKNLLLQSELKKHQQKQDGSIERFKQKIQILEQDISALEKEREKLKESLFALEQKNIDLAIQNAKLTAEVERKGSNSSGDRSSFTDTLMTNNPLSLRY